VIEPDTGLVTAAAITKSAGEDATDAAYGTGGLLRALGAAGDTVLIRPTPLAMAVDCRFTIDDVTNDQHPGR
jgi:hypothetical protein